MTPAHVRKVLQKYDAELGKKGYSATRHSESSNLGHVRWMCQETIKFLPDPYCACGAPSCDLCHPPPRDTPPNVEKAMRWLGFIQGCLWMVGEKTVDEMREDNRASPRREG